ncbi:MAG TPA: hypothetical protein VK838_00415 [Candidatus Limnocylindrales bacterium]|nr:hypothetical protein [Candidatus Limnocylindrales bacterium]
MTDIGFVIAGWAVILGGLAAYAITLVRRLQSARDASLRIRHAADAVEPPQPGARG